MPWLALLPATQRTEKYGFHLLNLPRKGSFGNTIFEGYELAKKWFFYCRKETWDIAILENSVVSDFPIILFDTDFVTFDFFHAFNILYIKKFNFEELFPGVGGNEHALWEEVAILTTRQLSSPLCFSPQPVLVVYPL